MNSGDLGEITPPAVVINVTISYDYASPTVEFVLRWAIVLAVVIESASHAYASVYLIKQRRRKRRNDCEKQHG